MKLILLIINSRTGFALNTTAPTNKLRDLVKGTGRRVPANFNMRSFCLAMLRDFDKKVKRRSRSSRNTQPDGVATNAAATINAVPTDAPATINAVPSAAINAVLSSNHQGFVPAPSNSSSAHDADRQEDFSQLLPMELTLMIFHYSEWSDKCSLRLANHKLGQIGLINMMDDWDSKKEGGKRTRGPIELHFGVRRHDLEVLNAVLSNETIVP